MASNVWDRYAHDLFSHFDFNRDGDAILIPNVIEGLAEPVFAGSRPLHLAADYPLVLVTIQQYERLMNGRQADLPVLAPTAASQNVILNPTDHPKMAVYTANKRMVSMAMWGKSMEQGVVPRVVPTFSIGISSSNQLAKARMAAERDAGDFDNRQLLEFGVNLNLESAAHLLDLEGDTPFERGQDLTRKILAALECDKSSLSTSQSLSAGSMIPGQIDMGVIPEVGAYIFEATVNRQQAFRFKENFFTDIWKPVINLSQLDDVGPVPSGGRGPVSHSRPVSTGASKTRNRGGHWHAPLARSNLRVAL